jgi:hypothetical protein
MPLGEADFGDASGRRACGGRQAALEHRAGAATDAHVARLEDLEGDQAGVDQVAELVAKNPGAAVSRAASSGRVD